MPTVLLFTLFAEPRVQPLSSGAERLEERREPQELDTFLLSWLALRPQNSLSPG